MSFRGGRAPSGRGFSRGGGGRDSGRGRGFGGRGRVEEGPPAEICGKIISCYDKVTKYLTLTCKLRGWRLCP
jgi:hypothetical protein